MKYGNVILLCVTASHSLQRSNIKETTTVQLDYLVREV
jgi:hypothetical protein